MDQARRGAVRDFERYPLGSPGTSRSLYPVQPVLSSRPENTGGIQQQSADVVGRPPGGDVNDFRGAARSGAFPGGIPVKDPRIRRRPVGPVAALENGANRGAGEPVACSQVGKRIPVESGDPIPRPEPQKPVRIGKNAVHAVARQAVGRRVGLQG